MSGVESRHASRAHGTTAPLSATLLCSGDTRLRRPGGSTLCLGPQQEMVSRVNDRPHFVNALYRC